MKGRSTLRLHRETIRELGGDSLADVAGGVSITCEASCIPTSVIITEILLREALTKLGNCSNALAPC
jgi:hypothetical protein